MTYPNPSFSGLIGLFGYANSVTNNLFVPVMLISLWAIVFLYLHGKNYGSMQPSVTAGFIVIWPAVLFRFMVYNGTALLSDLYLFIAVLMLVVPVLFMTFTNRSY